MPSLAAHQSNSFTKLLLIGDAKSGKTGSLVSLVKAGYKLRILDLDNLLNVLKEYILKECPELIGNVEFITLRDNWKSSALGPVIAGKPKAFRAALNLIDEWKSDDGTSLGRPDSWGPECILVVDSLSRLCDAAYDHYEPLVPRGKDGNFDPRAVYGNAQDGIESLLAHLTSDNFRTNVIVIAHVAYQEMPDGTTKGFPQGVGQKLSPKIPQYFSTVILYTHKHDKRTIRTNSTPMIDLANPKPFDMQPDYDISTGLASIFATLRGQSVSVEPTKPAPTTAVKPKSITLRRA